MFNTTIRESNLSEGYITSLLAGDRANAKQVIEDAMNCGVEATEILSKLVWPVMEQIQFLHKEDRVSKMGLNLATRLNRLIADQLATKIEAKPSNGKRVIVICGDDEPEELGGQICSDLFEADGWEVRFVGGGVPNDEMLPLIGEFRPNLLVMFATRAAGVPSVRKLIDYLRDMNSNPDMQILCAGGIYKRAEGLAEEIGADLYAPDAADAVRVASDNPLRKATAEQQTVGRSRRNRKPAPAARRDVGPITEAA